jgi:preprotein translocase subunit SecD
MSRRTRAAARRRFVLILVLVSFSSGTCIFDSGEPTKQDEWQPTVRVVLESPREADLAVAKSVVEKRLDALDVKNKATVVNGRLVVETAGFSLDEARRNLNARGRLRLMEMAVDEGGRVVVSNPDGSKTSMTLNRVLSDRPLIQSAVFVPLAVADRNGVLTELTSELMLLEESALQKSSAGLDEVKLIFNDLGAELMDKATLRLSDPPQPIALWLDDVPLRDEQGLIVAPIVISPISREAIIAGLSNADARRLYASLRSGELPPSVHVTDAVALP